jgi:sugar phosphate isomerase/epimerase
MNLRLAFSMPTPTSHALELALRNCHALGYHGALLLPAQYEQFLGNPSSFLGRWANWTEAIAGLLVEAAITTGDGRRRIEQAMDLAVGMDGDQVVLRCEGPALSALGDRTPQVIEHLVDLARRARQRALRLSVSNDAGGLIETQADLDVFNAAADPGLPGLALDVGRLAASGVPRLATSLGPIHGRLENVILTDIARSRFPMLEGGQPAFCPFGEGDLDFRPVFEVFQGVDYRGWLTVAHQTPPDRPIDSLRTARQLLERLGVPSVGT